MFSSLELDKTEIVSLKDDDNYSFLTNFGISISFEKHTHFFASIGYMALQVALIEENIRQSMIQITKDFDAVKKQTKGKNLKALISLYELVFLAKFGHDLFLKENFYAVKKILIQAADYRNDAVHRDWMFINGNPEQPCYEVNIAGEAQYIVISPDLMRRRALFSHEVYNLMDCLRALTETEGWDEEARSDAKSYLDSLRSA